MKIEQYRLFKNNEYDYPVYGTFVPTLTAYLHDEEAEKPSILVIPGGGYTIVSSSEGEIVAKFFYNKGYQTFVLTYTTNPDMNHPLYFQPLKELARAIRMVRLETEHFKVDPGRIAVCGFSAGGHLAASLLVHWDATELRDMDEYEGICDRPDAAILCYPVITTGKYAHRNSIIALLGGNATDDELEYMSLEKHVTADTPPVFLWHTLTDQTVPVENSLMFAEALRKKNIQMELHIYGEGRHGMSLANETWVREGENTGLYSQEQLFEYLQYLVDTNQSLPEEYSVLGKPASGTDIRSLYLQLIPALSDRCPDKAIAEWAELSDLWLRRIWHMPDLN